MHGLAFNSIHQQSKCMFHILLEDVWSQGISSESMIMKILTISVRFLLNNWHLCLIPPSDVFAINLACSSSVTQQGQSTQWTVDIIQISPFCWNIAYILFIFLHSWFGSKWNILLSYSVSYFIHILKLVLSYCLPWISLLLFCNVHSHLLIILTFVM